MGGRYLSDRSIMRSRRGINDPALRAAWLQARTRHSKCFVRKRHVVRNVSGVRSAIRERHHNSFRKVRLPLQPLRDLIISFPGHGCEGNFAQSQYANPKIHGRAIDVGCFHSLAAVVCPVTGRTGDFFLRGPYANVVRSFFRIVRRAWPTMRV